MSAALLAALIVSAAVVFGSALGYVGYRLIISGCTCDHCTRRDNRGGAR